MDDLDHRLVALLRHDGRTPVSHLARATGVSRATVRARIDRMLADGTIRGFTVELGTHTPGGIRAIMLVAVEGTAAEAVIRALHGFPEIPTIHATNGRWDVVAEIDVPDLPAFDDLLRRVRRIDGIASTETSLLLRTRKGR